jgi:anti-sigma regulatory factor (Ser/Thr protein kinase)
MLLLLAAAGLAAQQTDPATLPARDAHEGLLIAADPIDDAARAKERFGKKSPHSVGILALEVYFKNDTSKAIRVDLDRIRLSIEAPGQDRQQLRPMPVEAVVNAIVYPEGLNPTAPRKPRPFPGSGTGSKSKDVKQVDEVLRPLSMEMDILPPRATVRGLLFFNLDRNFDKLQYAQLYIPDLAFVADGKQLMFFEVDLSKAVRK